MNEKWNFKITLCAQHGQVPLLHMAKCFGIKNRDTIFLIAMKSADENTKNKLKTCYNGIESIIERDVSVLKEKGFAYYVNEHAKPYINAAYTKEKTAKALQHLQIMAEWQEFGEVKAVLRDMFTAKCFNTIFIDKKQFVIAAIEDEGREPVQYSEILTEEYVKKIRREIVKKHISVEREKNTSKLTIKVQKAWYIGKPTAQEQVEALQAKNIPYEVIASLVYKKGLRGFGLETIGLLLCTDGGDEKEKKHYQRKTEQLRARAAKHYNIKLV